jgi:hypothetical protein
VPQTKPTPKPINRPNQTEQSRLIEASSLLSFERPQFRHFNEHRECGRFRNAWNADQDGEFVRA